MKTIRLMALACAATAAAAMCVAPASAEATAKACAETIEGGSFTGLTVEEGQTCTLKNATVNGPVSVGKGANLLLEGGLVRGDVTVAQDGFFDATKGLIAGNVKANDAHGLYFRGTRVHGELTTSATDSAVAPFLFTDEGATFANVRVAKAQAAFNDTQVRSNIFVASGDYVDLIRTSAWGNIIINDQANGTMFCGARAVNSVSLYNNASVQFGPGDRGTCEDTNTIGTALIINRTQGKLSVANTNVAGLLTGFNNAAAPTVGDNVKVGTRAGQFRAAQARLAEERSVAAPSTLEQRRQAILDARTERLAQAGR